MSNVRRPVSLLTSLLFGLGGVALLLLLAASGATPAAAAPAHIGPNPPLPSNCHARNDSNTLLVYDSADSLALRLAVAAALPNDIVRLAGTCAGVAAGGGTTQTVLINKVLTLRGGYTPTDWVNTFPLTQPTTLDALGQGRVITASGDLTITNLTVQNGNSAGGDGGGIWDGHDLTATGAVNILSNTTLVSTTVAGAAAPAGPPPPGGEGGGAFAKDLINMVHASGYLYALKNNSGLNAGCAEARQIIVNYMIANDNFAQANAGCLKALASLDVADSSFSHNHAGHYAGGIELGGQSTIARTTSNGDSAGIGGGFLATDGGFGLNLFNVSVSNDTAARGAVIYGYGYFLNIRGSWFHNNYAFEAGGVLFDSSSFVDSTNNVFVANGAPLGNVIYITNFLGDPFTIQQRNDNLVSCDDFVFCPSHLADAAGARPSASAVVSPGAAVFVDGATLFVTDTIIGGYATDIAASSAPSTSVHEDYNLFEHTPVFSGTVITGGHSLVGNPLFADNLGHLSAGSPAIDHGIDVGVNVDFDGNPRPLGAGFDIGAYEYVAALLKLFLPLVRR